LELEKSVAVVLINTFGSKPFIEELDLSANLMENIPDLDSMGIVSLITALEEYFHIAFDDEDIVAEYFETISSLTEFVKLKVQ